VRRISMFKRIGAFLTMILMALVFPVVRAQGSDSKLDNSPGSQAGTPVLPSPGAPVPLNPVPPDLSAPAGEAPENKNQETALSQPNSDLEKQLAGKTEELKQAGTRIAALEAEITRSSQHTSELEGGLQKATRSYKNVLAAANPDILPDLLNGDSIEALDSSLARAKELIGRVRSHLEAQARDRRIPAGAPQRRIGDVSGLAPGDKIREGLGRGR
jgi:hypothetical protein